MNQDEITSAATKVVLGAFATYLGAHGVDVSTVPGAIGAIGTLASFGFGVYQHWNMKKVPETATVVGAK